MWGTDAGLVSVAGLYFGSFSMLGGMALTLVEEVRKQNLKPEEQSQLAKILALPAERQLALARVNPALADFFLRTTASLKAEDAARFERFGRARARITPGALGRAPHKTPILYR